MLTEEKKTCRTGFGQLFAKLFFAVLSEIERD
jgi:hypothetical protein